MPEVVKQQLLLDFEAGLSRVFNSGREVIHAGIHRSGKALKVVAADMDLSPSQLCRKLAQNPDDSARLTLDDAENYMDKTGDLTLIEYLVDRYLARASVERIETLEKELARLKGQQHNIQRMHAR